MLGRIDIPESFPAVGDISGRRVVLTGAGRGLAEMLTHAFSRAFLGAPAAARIMGDGGRLIFTGSVLGERPGRGLAAYSASKAGLVGMSKALTLWGQPADLVGAYLFLASDAAAFLTGAVENVDGGYLLV